MPGSTTLGGLPKRRPDQYTAPGGGPTLPPTQVSEQILASGLATAANQTTQIGHESATETNTAATAANVEGISGQAWTSSGLAIETGGTLSSIETSTALLGTGIALPTGAATETGVTGISGQAWTSSGLAIETGGTLSSIDTSTTTIVSYTDTTATNTGTTATNTGTTATNVATSNGYLGGTSPGALIGVASNTIGKEVAAWIASGSVSGTPGGTPLLHGMNNLLTNESYTVPTAGNGSVSTDLLAVHKPGYVINISATISSLATGPWVDVFMYWFDDTGTYTMDQEEWVIPAASTGSQPVQGKGPTKGSYVKLVMYGADPDEEATAYITLAETTQHIARDDWRQLVTSGGTVPGWNYSSVDLGTNVLFNEFETSIAANATVAYLLPLYCGLAWFNTVAASDIEVRVLIPDGVPNWTGSQAIIWLDDTTTNQSLQLPLPRVPCVLEFTNNSASAIVVDCMCVILEYAS